MPFQKKEFFFRQRVYIDFFYNRTNESLRKSTLLINSFLFLFYSAIEFFLLLLLVLLVVAVVFLLLVLKRKNLFKHTNCKMCEKWLVDIVIQLIVCLSLYRNRIPLSISNQLVTIDKKNFAVLSPRIYRKNVVLSFDT